MGRRGPPPKPTKLKVLQGNPGHQKLNMNEPEPRQSSGMRCPKWMPPEGRREWRRVVPELERLGLLSIVDQASLEGYCQSYADWRKNVDWITENGDVLPIRDKVTGKITYLQQVPQVGMAQKALNDVRKFAQEFGLTPAARARLQTANKEVDQSELEKYFA